MKELTVKSVISSNTKKDGTPLVGKFGPYFLIRIETEEEGWVSMFGKKASELKAGDKILGNLEVKEVNGFTNKNFTPAKPSDENTERIQKLERRVTTLELSFDRKLAELRSELLLETKGVFQTKSQMEDGEKRIEEYQGADDFANVPAELDF